MAGAKTIRIGGASGFWGDAAIATPQLLGEGDLDFIVYDYLAEITLSIMARARAQDPSLGYATDFISAALKPNLPEIARQGVKIVSNAGGVNPRACAEAARQAVAAAGLTLKVAVVLGDDLTEKKEEFATAGTTEMFSGAPFPAPGAVASINAYLGAAGIAEALRAGADIVITGRCVDSAVTLGACLAAFDWAMDDFDRLAQASLAGHLIECGPQSTGGNFTDWRDVPGPLSQIGYPIVEVEPSGAFRLTKPKASTGLVTPASVGEQLLYEIGDPQAYLLPDVACDFSEARIEQDGQNAVRVTGAKGYAPPETYKVSCTYQDGWRAGLMLNFTGFEAADKAEAYAKAAFERCETLLRLFNLGPFEETSVEILGAGSQLGAAGARPQGPSEVTLKAAVKHPDPKGAGMFLREATGLALATPPGLTMFSGGRPKPSPVVRLFSFAAPKQDIEIQVEMAGETVASLHDRAFGEPVSPARPAPPEPVATPTPDWVRAPLIRFAWARSGDKGDKANIGIIARKPELLPYLWAQLDEAALADAFAHFEPSRVERFYLPGLCAINFLLHDVLGGGGVASLRADPQGKAYGQILLARTIAVPAELAAGLA